MENNNKRNTKPRTSSSRTSSGNKSTTKRKTKSGGPKLSENMAALLFIFLGIFISLSLRTTSMGVVGQGVKYIFLGLFSKLSILIAFMLIFAGIYKLIYGEKFQYKTMKKLPVILLSFWVILVYGLFNTLYFPKSTPLSLDNSRLILATSNRGDGIGLIPSVVVYYLDKLIGFYGSIFLSVVLIIFILIRYFKLDMSKIMAFMSRAPFQMGRGGRRMVERIQNFVLVEDKEESISEETIHEEEIPQSGSRLLHESEVFDLPKPAVDFKENESNQIELTIKKYNDTRNRDLGNYSFPPLELLKTYEKQGKQELTPKSKSSRLLESTLMNFGVDARVKSVSQGPTITRYELEPKAGTKVSKITNLQEDLALALAATTIRIEAPIPGKSLIGIEVPNLEGDIVTFKEIIQSGEFMTHKSHISFGLGRDIAGQIMVPDVSKMPHLLVAGATGSGKSVCINTLICSVLYKYSPAELKMIMIDPKMVELSIYNGIPHLLVPVVTDMKKAPSALNWAVAEMNRRYKQFAEWKVKDINGYNEKAEEKMPRILIIVDELADLMMVSPNEVEEAISRLAQMARACGMHLVIATQRPSVDVITGLIKANIPSRIAFAVSSQTDSRTILDMGGAEKLLGKGDMLFYPMGASKPVRVQGAFITEDEVVRVTDFIRANNQEEADQTVQEELDTIQEVLDSEDDPLMEEIIDFIVEKEQASTSLLQRRFRMGYNRASRIMDQLESKGIISPADGSRPRRVNIDKNERI